MDIAHTDLDLALRTVQLQALVEQYERICEKIRVEAHPLYRKREAIATKISQLMRSDMTASINGMTIKRRAPRKRRLTISAKLNAMIRSAKSIEVKRK